MKAQKECVFIGAFFMGDFGVSVKRKNCEIKQKFSKSP